MPQQEASRSQPPSAEPQDLARAEAAAAREREAMERATAEAARARAEADAREAAARKAIEIARQQEAAVPIQRLARGMTARRIAADARQRDLERHSAAAILQRGQRRSVAVRDARERADELRERHSMWSGATPGGSLGSSGPGWLGRGKKAKAEKAPAAAAAPVSAVKAKRLEMESQIAEIEAKRTLNPFSEHYIGPEAHAQKVGTSKYGSPTQLAMERALPGQVATLLNVLRFVDAVNHLMREGLVPVVGADQVAYDDVMRWSDRALMSRFSGAVQYFRSARKYGFVEFEGEVPQGQMVRSRSLKLGRDKLLSRALEQPKLLSAAMPSPRLKEMLTAQEILENFAEYKAESFADLFYSA